MTVGQQLNIQDYPFEIKDRYGNVIYREHNFDTYGIDGRVFPNRIWWRREFDSLGNCILSVDNDGIEMRYKFDDMGNNVFSINSSDQTWIERSFDEYRNLIRSRNSEGVVWYYSYGNNNSTLKQYSSNGVFKKTTIHSMGKSVFTKKRGDKFWTEEHFNKENVILRLETPHGTEYYNKLNEEYHGVHFVENGIRTDKVFLDTRSGQEYQGGIIVFTDNQGRGLICSPHDLGDSYWYSAKSICSKYKLQNLLGWRLPTKDELSLIYINLFQRGIGVFSKSYWCSCNQNDTDSWVHDFNKGRIYRGDTFQGETHFLLPVREVNFELNSAL